tara:strand:- start:587 stop:862 length:276 start_codon:yes stop_codon:yes gene_type:complete
MSASDDKSITKLILERIKKMLAKARSKGRPFKMFKHVGRGRPKESILRAFLFHLKYSKAKHVLTECEARSLTITQYFDDLVSKDIENNKGR